MKTYDHNAIVEMYLECFDCGKVVRHFGCSQSTVYKALASFLKNKSTEQLVFIGEHKNYCAHFGCVRELTLLESLCGNKCQPHTSKTFIDPVKHLSL